MKFKKLTLYTNQLQSEYAFYVEALGFEVLERDPDSFSVKVGWSELSFIQSESAHIYHYCFLIPANKLHEALDWMEKRTEVVDIENGRKTQHFDTWNADSFYFYDGSGNLAEFIVRYDLENEDEDDFSQAMVLGVNEMGMPTTDIEKLNAQLEAELTTRFWKGDRARFGTNGSQEGIFLLPNYKVKNVWFPTSQKLQPEPFEAIIENEGKIYGVEFRNEKVTTTPVKS